MENLLSGQGESTRTCNVENGAQVGGYGNCICKTLHYLLIGVFGIGWLNNKSRMSREAHVRICEQLKGEGSLWLTRPPVERFFSSLKREWTGDRLYRTRHEAIADVREYVAVYYNAKRLHSTLGYKTPLDYEKKLNKVSGNS